MQNWFIEYKKKQKSEPGEPLFPCDFYHAPLIMALNLLTVPTKNYIVDILQVAKFPFGFLWIWHFFLYMHNR